MKIYAKVGWEGWREVEIVGTKKHVFSENTYIVKFPYTYTPKRNTITPDGKYVSVFDAEKTIEKFEEVKESSLYRV